MSTNSEFEERTAKTPTLFVELIGQPLLAMEQISAPKAAAIYVFYFNDQAVHVGRTRNLRQRLRGHITNSHYSASFAFKRARSETNIQATYKKGEGRSDLLANPIFAAAFAKSLGEVKGMKVRYLVVENPIDQYLLELYAALELKTSLTEFDTH